MHAPPPASSASQAPEASAAGKLEVTVTEPVKHNEGGGLAPSSYIAYKVNTATDRPEYRLGQTSVIRRYSDFLWLHAKLAAAFPVNRAHLRLTRCPSAAAAAVIPDLVGKHPDPLVFSVSLSLSHTHTYAHTNPSHVVVLQGAIIPPLPEKGMVGRFEASFVETRRRALERFLKRVAAHVELSASADLATFLQADEGALHQAREEVGWITFMRRDGLIDCSTGF